MPELVAAALDVICCQAERATLDRLVPPGHGARILRTAPDEMLITVAAGSGHDVVREVSDRLAALDPDAIALDVTDGWTALTLRGHDAVAAFARLSPLEPPSAGGFVQGDVARVGAKVLGEHDGSLTVLVPSYVGAYLRERCIADAGGREAGG